MNSRLSAIIAIAFFIIALLFILWLGVPSARQEALQGDRIFVVTTVYPVSDFVKNIGGDLVYVSNAVPAGAEPHDYEPTPREVAQVLEADVFIYVGGGFDAWAEDLADEVVAEGGYTLGIEDRVQLAVTEEDGEEEEHAGEGVDPHVWLDPVEAQRMVEAIRDALIAVDPSHETQYRTYADIYIERLDELDVAYANSLDDCQLNDIIVSHDAFGYLARRYDFNVHPISGLSPEAEPSARDLVVLADEARELGVTTIFFETLVSPRLSETLAQEIGATTAILNPLEGLSEQELQAGDDYLSVMQKNREALSSAMLCQ